MPASADLELTLQRRDSETCRVELRYLYPDAEVDNSATATVRLDLADLRARTNDYTDYGRALGKSLFVDDVAIRFAEARAAAAQHADLSLRLRLRIDPGAPDLHSLWWETLCDLDGTALATSERILFSRYLSSRDWSPVRLRARDRLRVLLAVAHPSDLDRYGFTDFNPVDERDRVLQAITQSDTAPADLGRPVPVVVDELISGATPLTLDALMAGLRRGCDVLCLIAHGRYWKNSPQLLLQETDGKTAFVEGADLVRRIAELAQRPRLIVLISCQSAGTGQSSDAVMQLTLGPRLVEIGVPVVVAMQGKISVETVQKFLPTFFSTLRATGQVDLAMARARGDVRARTDYWMPVLFSRLRSGQIWYEPALSDAGNRGRGADKWPAILSGLKGGTCTPILGPDMTEPLLGPRVEIARRLALEYKFPLAPPEKVGLPQVAQYLSVYQDVGLLSEKLVGYLLEGIKTLQDAVPPELQQMPAVYEDQLKLLDELMKLAWTQRAGQLEAEPHRVLARLPFKLYITTDQSNLLATALRAEGREPIVRLCPWCEEVAEDEALWKFEGEPDAQHPLIYHMFGNLQYSDSLVLCEDDFFDYLIGVTRNKESVPPLVKESLVETRTIYLGFRPDDWYFRVFFRTVMSLDGRNRRTRMAHVAAQIAPDDVEVLDMQRTRSYLEDYFGQADISIYWGSVEDFMRDLQQRMGGG